jgi:hypothetical protein
MRFWPGRLYISKHNDQKEWQKGHMQQDRGEERDDEKIEQVKDGGGPGTGNEGGCLSVCICACGNVWFLLASLFVFRRRWQFGEEA